MVATVVKAVNEEMAYSKIINCITAVGLRNVGNYLYKITYKREKKIENL
jgi:hypothetical protein